VSAENDRRFAGDHVRWFGQQAGAGRRQGLGPRVRGQVADGPLRNQVRQHRRDAAHHVSIAAERLNLQSKPRQKLALLD
jgi:hypothetical protein